MKIAFVVSEMYPLIKTGGLADVAYALPKALKKKGEDVRVFLPKYLQLNLDEVEAMHKVTEVLYKGEIFNIIESNFHGMTVYLIENRTFFERESIYDNHDRDTQFAIFGEVVIKSLKKLDFKPDVMHLNDWQTGLVPYMLRVKYKNDDFYKNIKTIFTIHNLRYQGHFGKGALNYLEYPFEDEHVNFMKIGILNADKVNTVSRTYAKEIQTSYYGEGLEGILRGRSKDLYGILNGIDYDIYNPETDKNIEKTYDAISLENKKINKLAIQKYFGLVEDEDTALVALVTRLDPQKGLDLLDHIIKELLEYDNLQIVILGSGSENYEKKFKRLEKRYPEKLAVEIGYNAKLAHKIYAGSDMFLMPSQFEPCGLSQLIALKYGSIPIVRETGGLNDTIEAYNEFTGQGNGFSFTNYNAHDMMYTIRKALNYYYNSPNLWRGLILKAMSDDFSWDKSADEYLELYKHK